MVDMLIQLVSSLPPQLAVVVLAMTPVGENRLSVPVALGVYQLSVVEAIAWSVLGSVLAAAIITYVFSGVVRILRGRVHGIDRLLNWFFERTERKFSAKYKRWGEVALLLFVAVPLPVTGVWTGSVAAWLFGIPPRRALLFITGGVILSASIVALASLGFISIF